MKTLPLKAVQAIPFDGTKFFDDQILDESKIAEDRSRSPSTKSAESITGSAFKPPVNSTPGKVTRVV